MRVLIVEDDPLLGPGLQTGLRQDGYAADWVSTAAAAEHSLALEHFDLMILDLGLPDRDGVSLLRDLRRQDLRFPVLVLTARDEVEVRVAALDAGADDFLTKPFDLDELSARVRALGRRSRSQAGPVLAAGDLILDTNRRAVTVAGRSVDLSPREYAVLEALAGNAGRVLPRQSLQQSVYGWQEEVESNALEVHIHNLRRKLGAQRILTVRGVGYRLVALPPA